MIGDYKKPLLSFSGGKDSTALLYMARPWLDRITVVFCETGATFPHLVRHIERTCEKLGATLVTIRPPMNVMDFTQQHGFPADIVPVEASAAMLPFLKQPPAQLLQPYTQCCGAMLWAPLLKYTHENGYDLVLRGSKKADTRVGAGPVADFDGVRYASPLWDWSDADVYAYLKEQGADLPEHYPQINDSLDCWLCTAHLAHHGDEKMRYIRERYPDLWPVVSERMARVRAMIMHEAGRVAPAFEAAGGV